MNEGLMKIAEGYEMIAAGIRQMVSEGRGVPEAAEKRLKRVRQRKRLPKRHRQMRRRQTGKRCGRS